MSFVIYATRMCISGLSLLSLSMLWDILEDPQRPSQNSSMVVLGPYVRRSIVKDVAGAFLLHKTCRNKDTGASTLIRSFRSFLTQRAHIYPPPCLCHVMACRVTYAMVSHTWISPAEETSEKVTMTLAGTRDPGIQKSNSSLYENLTFVRNATILLSGSPAGGNPFLPSAGF